MGALLAPDPMFRAYDNNNNPLAGGQLYTYQAGTTTPAATYTDSTAGTPNPNPVLLNARGEAPVWMNPTQAYKLVLKDASGNTIWTVDQVTSPAPVAVGNMTDEKGSNGQPGFSAANGDFTPGTTTSLTLSNNYGSASNLWVAFDAGEQGADTYSLSGTTLTFNAPIPNGISRVYVKGGTALTISTPSAGTVTDSSVAANAAIQSTKLAFLQGGAGAQTQTVQEQLRKRVYATDFQGVDSTGATDSTAGLAAAWTYVSSNAQQIELVFPQGIYEASSFPNFAVNHARVIPEGEVRLRYTGTGTAIALDAGSGSQNVYDVTFGLPGQPFIVESASTTSNCVFVRAVHHSTICVKPRTAGASSAGLAVNFAVCTKFYMTCSVNEDGGWYNGQQPTYGIYLTKRNAAEQVSYCTFYTPVIEGPVNGIYLDWADGNLFLGGTAEACSNIGVTLTANATRNTFHNMDFEVNTTSDWDDSGVQNTMIKCDTNLLATLKGTNGEIQGGSHNAITVAGSSTGAWLHDLRYNRNGNGAVITDAGVLTRKQGCFNAAVGGYDGPAAAFAITASSGTYTNNRTVNVGVAMSGGTVTNVTLTRGGTGTAVYSGSSLGSGIFETSPGDVLTWAGNPSVVNGYPRVSV